VINQIKIMAKTADIGSKRLISLSPDPWVQWVTQIPTLKAQEIINSDFQWVSRQGDVLMKVSSPETGEFLLLNEIQLRHDDEIQMFRLSLSC
jgi:predicted transposase YdaD